MILRPSLIQFAKDRRGSTAAEFAMVVPVFLLFLLGIIDVGRWIWAVNENEKAAQIGARWAVATDMICSGLTDWSFATDQMPPVEQGSVVEIADFPGVSFAGGSATACECADDGDCSFPLTADVEAFADLVGRMNDIQPRLGANNVSVDYAWSGLGYAGDPNGPDVSPTVTVTIGRMDFRPLFLAGLIALGLPGAQYSLTMEDAEGDFAN
jgi:hypothetical protein